MSRLKKFFWYAIGVLAFFIFSQVMIYIAINTTYKYKNIEVNTTIIKDAEVQATSINGFVKCKVVNDTKNIIEDKYIKINCYSENNTIMGTKYIRIDKIESNEEKEFEVRFNFNKVDRVKLEVVNKIDENIPQEQLHSDSKMNLAMIITALIMLINFG